MMRCGACVKRVRSHVYVLNTCAAKLTCVVLCCVALNLFGGVNCQQSDKFLCGPSLWLSSTSAWLCPLVGNLQASRWNTLFYTQPLVPEFFRGLDRLPFCHLNFIILLVYDSLSGLVFDIIQGSKARVGIRIRIDFIDIVSKRIHKLGICFGTATWNIKRINNKNISYKSRSKIN